MKFTPEHLLFIPKRFGPRPAIVCFSAHKTPRIYVHRRHHTAGSAEELSRLSLEGKKFDTRHWCEIQLKPYLHNGSFRTVTPTLTENNDENPITA